jgi:hypothetical protein
MSDKGTENKKYLEGEVTELIERKILFNPPKHDVVIDIGDIIKTVKVTDTKVLNDYVVVSGFLNKSVLYRTAKIQDGKEFLGEEEEEKDKKDDKDNKGDNDKDDKDKDKDNKDKKDGKDEKGAKCESLVPECSVVDGVVRHVTTWIPFEALIRVDGAEPCDEVEVVYAKVLDPLEGKYIEDGKCILGLIEKDVIKIKIRVKRD